MTSLQSLYARIEEVPNVPLDPELAMLVLAILTTVLFGRIRPLAAWLMVPYLVWISFAGVLTWRIGALNPGAETLVPAAHTSQML